MTPDEAVERARAALKAWRAERRRLDRLDRYLHGRHDAPFRPKEATAEYDGLRRRAITPILPLVVQVVEQTLFVEGYRSSASADNAAAWGLWQANGMDGRQGAVHRAALGYGVAFTLVMPGSDGPVIRGVSPRSMLAVYDDPSVDEWPTFAIRVTNGDAKGTYRVRVYDDEQVHELVTGERSDEQLAVSDEREPLVHGVGVCPVVRYAHDLDLEGRSMGLVEPLIPLQDRLDQTVLDLLLTQTFASWKVRTVAGMAEPDSTAEAAAKKLLLAQDRVLVADDPDTRFGSLDETPLAGFIEAVELVVRQIATLSQVPPHHLLGQMANLSAEALAAAESGLQRLSTSIQHPFGESHEQTLRLAGVVANVEDLAGDESAQVRWRDTESRSLAQVADALGKLATMLQVPPDVLWERIPGVTDQDVVRWRAARDQALAAGALDLADILDRQSRPGDPALIGNGAAGGV